MTQTQPAEAGRDQPNEWTALPFAAAAVALVRCAGACAVLLARRRVRLPRRLVGARMTFADGTSAVVYRETVVDQAPPADPCALVVRFRLRGARGAGHTVFRWESILNTVLFVGFPGFVSKLWLAHDQRGQYRGVYEWDGPARAEAYVRALWWPLALVCVRGSIDHVVLPGMHRDELPDRAETTEPGDWWRPVAVRR